MKLLRDQRLLDRVGTTRFLRAQKDICPLCGDATWAQESEEERATGLLQPLGRTWDHVFARGHGHGLAGNTLVVHALCNQRKSGAQPMVHEVAILKTVNRRLGWDGVTYHTTPAGRLFYDRLATAAAHRGLDYVTRNYTERAALNLLHYSAGLKPTPPEVIPRGSDLMTYEKMVERRGYWREIGSGVFPRNPDTRMSNVLEAKLREVLTARIGEHPEIDDLVFELINGTREVLNTPQLLWLNMLRGGLEKPTVREIVHLYGEKALREEIESRG